jgi:hypothetical protein
VARQEYQLDDVRKVADPVHPRWFTASGVAELNDRLRSPEVALALRGIARAVPASRRRRLPDALLRLTREVLLALYDETASQFEAHLRNYPLPEIDPEMFRSPTGRAASERYLRILRAHAPGFRPRPLRRSSVLSPILVFGTSRSAESLRMHALAGTRIAWNLLENQRGSAHADYCLDITAIGTTAALDLLAYWWDGKDPAEERGIQEAYDTLLHEMLHRACDLANPFGPQYGPKGSAKEHYFMEEYEPFASAVERHLLEHLVRGGERGILRRRLR